MTPALVKSQILTCVFDKSPPSWDFPQFGNRVFPAGQDVFGVFGEDCRAHLSSVMGLLKGGDAAVRDAVPKLDAAVFAAGDITVGSGVVADATDGVRVLVQWVPRHKTLECVHIVEPQGGVLSAYQQEISRRVEGNGTQHFCFLQEKSTFQKQLKHSLFFFF